MIRKSINKILSKFGYNIVRYPNRTFIPDIDLDKEFKELYSFCGSYTMTSVERMYSLYISTKYIIENNIEGDFVECGVWKGGSAMLIAKYLKMKKIESRKIYLYDTFEGMTKPSKFDISYEGNLAIDEFSKQKTSEDSSNWCESGIEEVKQNMYSTDFNPEKIIFAAGKVEETIPNIIPDNKIALLRLDTDWYASTKHELIHLYHKLAYSGVLIIDDYGHWEGAKKAVTEYFQDKPILLNRIDYTGRVGIKT